MLRGARRTWPPPTHPPLPTRTSSPSIERSPSTAPAASHQLPALAQNPNRILKGEQDRQDERKYIITNFSYIDLILLKEAE